MNKIFVFILLLAVMVSVFACSKQPESNKVNINLEDKTPVDNAKPAESPDKMSFGDMYKFGSLKSYEYRITANAGGAKEIMNMKYSITSDTINGKSAWLQTSTASIQGGTVTTKMWLDKSTMKCLKITTESNFMGQKMEQEGSCPEEGLGSESSVQGEMPRRTGKETVTVPAGTFSTDKYSIGEANYYISPKVPIPVKYTFGNDVVMELVSYS